MFYSLFRQIVFLFLAAVKVKIKFICKHRFFCRGSAKAQDDGSIGQVVGG